MVAALPQVPVQGGDHFPEEGGGNVGQKNADGPTARGFEIAGKGIGPIVQRLDGVPDSLGVPGADVAAVYVL